MFYRDGSEIRSDQAAAWQVSSYNCGFGVHNCDYRDVDKTVRLAYNEIDIFMLYMLRPSVFHEVCPIRRF